MSAFRTDIQALRAIAVLLVLAFHVWPSRLTGGYVGVDVFFVISGYLITGHLLREVASTGRVDLPAFYARRARRLLPAATLTLVAVGVAAYLWMPRWTWATVAADMAASTVYAENLMLVRRAVDYHAQGQTPSPLQHFWSLAVEEQFYLGWPLLVAGVAAWWKRTRSRENHSPHLPEMSLPPPPRRAYALPMAGQCGFSFAAALYCARVSPASGYFMTQTRLHELGLGGLLGVWAARTPPVTHAGVKLGMPGGQRRASHWPRTLCAAAGLIAIGVSAFLFTARLPFPGAAALVPVLGAVVFIAAGEEGDCTDSTPAHALIPALAHPWLQYVGDISYSLYLAHWPVVVMHPFITGRAVDGVFTDGVTVVVLSWALAHSCKQGWEDRFRCTAGKSQSRAGGLAGAGAMTVGMTLAVAAVSFALHHQALHLEVPSEPVGFLPQPGSLPSANASALSVGAPRDNNVTRLGVHPDNECPFFMVSQGGTNSSGHFPGADVIMRGCSIINNLPISNARPSVGRASKDLPWIYSRQPPCIPKMDDAKLTPCEENPPSNASTPSYRPQHVVLIGDSHAAHWVPALDVVSRRMGFRYTCLTKPGCPPTTGLSVFPDGPRKGTPNLPCREWVGKAVAWVLREQPAAVLLSSYNYSGSINASNPTELADGVVDIARQMVAANIPVLGIKATPTLKEFAPQCLAMAEARNPGSSDLTACSTPQATALSHPNNPVNEAAKIYPIMRLLSFDDIFCQNQTCPPMIGNVVVYWDTHHMTATFSATLASTLQKMLKVEVPHLV